MQLGRKGRIGRTADGSQLPCLVLTDIGQVGAKRKEERRSIIAEALIPPAITISLQRYQALLYLGSHYIDAARLRQSAR